MEKTREEILAERQEKKKRKAALKNQSKKKDKGEEEDGTCNNSKKVANDNAKKNSSSKTLSGATSKDVELSASDVVRNVVVQQVKSNESSNKIKPSSKSDSLPASVENKKSDNSVESSSVGNESCKRESAKQKKKTSKGSESDKNARNESLSGEKTVVSDAIKAEVVKTKAQLKAERRAKQEAERERKSQKSAEKLLKKKNEPTQKTAEPVKVMKTSPSSVSQVAHKVKLFAHLYDEMPDSDAVDGQENVHPSIVQLGAQYSSRVVSGANASCLALLNALKKVVTTFETPLNQDFIRGLESEIAKSMSYLGKHRPVTVSMLNAVRHLKFKVNQTKGNDLECKNSINEWIDTYIKEQLEMAAKAICLFVREKITSGDVILTYGWSALIHQILLSAYNEGIKFRVIVADGRPWLEGRELLKKLVSVGIQCTYVFVNGLSFLMPEVTKILLGAQALLANGYVMSRIGSSQIALLAKTYNVPVLICCETHKFSERVQTDSFVYNELGNPDDLVSNKGCISKELSKWKSIPCLTPLNLMYDVTPPDLVSAVVTEIAVLPCTSVPVILRIKPPDLSF